MLLPFLKNKNAAGVATMIVKNRQPDEKPSESEEIDDPSAAIEACARALINAVHANDAKGAADAMCDAYTILQEMPEESDGPKEDASPSPHTYEDQKD